MDSIKDNTDTPLRLLIVGAGGFTGGFIAEEALRRGFDTYAGIRASTSRKYLSDKRIKFIELDFENPDSLADSLSKTLPNGYKWDYIVYNLGATKCTNFTDFNRINYEYLRLFTEALKQADKVPTKMLYMSSLSAMGPGDEKDYTPFSETRIPMPNTRYGASKIKAEMWLATAGIPYVIFRATGIYGPREKDYFLMFKSIAAGFDFSVGLRKQLLSFIYVEDIAVAIFDALQKAPVGKTYIIAEERSYTQKEFRTLVAKELGQRFVIPIRIPLWGVYIVSLIAEKIGLLRGRPATLNRDKFHIMRQRNWSADISAARRDFAFNPSTSLKEGIQRSIKWYRENNWLGKPFIP